MSKNMMKWTLGLLAVGCMLTMAGPAGAGFTQMDSKYFPLWGKYEMDVEPIYEDIDVNTVKDFTRNGSGTGVVTFPEAGILRMDTSTGTQYYSNGYAIPGQTWELLTPDITFASGYTFEFRVKIYGTTEPYGFNFTAVPDDNVDDALISVTDDDLIWGYGTSAISLSTASNTDDFHVFRVAQTPGQNLFSVWRDMDLLRDDLTGISMWNSDSMIWFGDVGGAWGGIMEIDYLRFTSGAYAPIPEPGMLVLLLGALVSLLVWRRR